MWIKALTVGAFLLGAQSARADCVPDFYKQVGSLMDVPPVVVYSLALTETGVAMSDGTFIPWHLSLNYAGKPYWYRDWQGFLAAIDGFIAEDKRSVDIGLFQVNYRWHAHRVASVHDLARPSVNGQVAMEILREQYERYGDWIVASGRYHNPANADGRADLYAERFKRWYERVLSGYFC
ncbi:transglycosylase SLT domain-containing protein [Vibrio sp. PNB22_3_1]